MKKEDIYRYYKPSDYRGLYLKRYYRFFGVLLARLLAKTEITPNQLTVFRTLLIFPSAFLISLGEYKYIFMGAILGLFTYFLDYVDGALARMKSMTTDMGYWLSYVADHLLTLSLFIGIILGTYKSSSNISVLIAGLIAVVSYQYLDSILSAFKDTFSFSGKVLEEQQKKKKFLLNFFYGDHFIVNTIILAALFNVLDAYIYFAAIWGMLNLLGVFIIFQYKALKMSRMK